MQEGGSQYGVSPEMTPFTATATRTHMLGAVSGDTHHLQQQQTVEVASPISSRPPGVSVARPSGNFDELVQVSGGFPDDDALAGEEGDRGVSGGNRWPRQETLALLKIRSEMDADFRNATLKGPLWEDVSRKLAELGYIRNAKKCKEKFENVHKYYKRTKEGRAGRQDGKSYRFFTQLEALQSSSNTSVTPAMPTTTTTPTNLIAAPVSIGIGISHPMVGSSARTQPLSISVTPATAATHIGVSSAGIPTVVPGSAAGTATGGISFSSDTSSSSSDSEDEFEAEPPNTDSRKRKRGSRGGSSSRKMMAFFEGLMKQVMEKQEAMQQRFLETIEKREQDRMIREEAWKRQEMARLTREHEIMAQERAISASRDAAIIGFLQKITGQTIQFPSTITIPVALPPQSTQPPPPPVAVAPPHHHHPHQQQQQQQHHHQQQQQQQQHNQSQNTEIVRHQSASSEVIIAVPEQQQPPQEMGSGAGGSFDPSSSRWPKTEVLALIKLRSGLESRYQEAGPKGPLWEEVSAGMQRMGYNRSSKRCKEKWENINKYFKKVKESNKKRPEDAKTCPYFHQLDALYRKKILGSSSGGSGSFGNQNKQEQQQESVNNDPNPIRERREVLEIMPPPQPTQAIVVEKKDKNNKDSGTDVQTSNGGSPVSLLGEGNISVAGGGSTKKPADIVKELIEQQQLVMDVYDKIEEPDSDNLDQEDDDDDDEDEEAEEERKLAYKIEFQRQNASSSNGGGNGAESFLAMVQ